MHSVFLLATVVVSSRSHFTSTPDVTKGLAVYIVYLTTVKPDLLLAPTVFVETMLGAKDGPLYYENGTVS